MEAFILTASEGSKINFSSDIETFLFSAIPRILLSILALKVLV
jgi:hypothetical protein